MQQPPKRTQAFQLSRLCGCSTQRRVPLICVLVCHVSLNNPKVLSSFAIAEAAVSLSKNVQFLVTHLLAENVPSKLKYKLFKTFCSFFRRDVLRDALREDQASSNAWPWNDQPKMPFREGCAFPFFLLPFYQKCSESVHASKHFSFSFFASDEAILPKNSKRSGRLSATN